MPFVPEDKLNPRDPLFWDPDVFLPHLPIKAKSGQLIPFNLWRHQRLLTAAVKMAYKENKWVCHVKARRTGSSTTFTAIAYQHVAFRYGCEGAILAHKQPTAQTLSNMAIRFHKGTPARLRPVRSKGLKRTLEFPDHDARLTIHSVRDDEPLRGDTCQMLLATEISSWLEGASDDAWTSARNAVSDDGGFLIAESTPRFHGDPLHQVWQEGTMPGNRWVRLFIPWTFIEHYTIVPPRGWQPMQMVREYQDLYAITDAQAYWMQTEGLPKCKYRLDKFQGEYPINDTECWVQPGESVFDTARLVERRRELRGDTMLAVEDDDFLQFGTVHPNHRYILAVDPASSFAQRDYWALEGIDLDECSQACEYRAHTDAHQMAKRVIELSNAYNGAWVYIEANGVGEALIVLLLAMGFNRIYFRRDAGGGRSKAGWWSDQKHKAQATAIAQELVADGSFTIYSLRLLDQLIQYRGQWDKLDRDASGGHFDLAAAFLIGCWAWQFEIGPGTHKALTDREREEQAFKSLMRRIDGLPHGYGTETPWGVHL